MHAGVPKGTPVFYFARLSRPAIFIDGGYLNKVLEQFGRTRIDYGKFSNLLAAGSELLRTYYYHCMPYRSAPPTPEEEALYASMRQFVDYLQKTPRLEVRLGRLAKRDKQCRQCRHEWTEFEQKRVDVLFAVDLTRLAASRQIGRCVLVTSDSDFVPAIQAAKNDGVLVQLYYSRGLSYNDELLQACDDRIEITPDLINAARR